MMHNNTSSHPRKGVESPIPNSIDNNNDDDDDDESMMMYGVGINVRRKLQRQQQQQQQQRQDHYQSIQTTSHAVPGKKVYHSTKFDVDCNSDDDNDDDDDGSTQTEFFYESTTDDDDDDDDDDREEEEDFCNAIGTSVIDAVNDLNEKSVPGVLKVKSLFGIRF
jgi:hypothetical protein